MSGVKDILSDICEMHSRGYKATTIAAILEVPYDMVEDAIDNYAAVYSEAFDSNKSEIVYA